MNNTVNAAAAMREKRISMFIGSPLKLASRTERALRDDKKLERMGFTRYVKSGDGGYEKTLGSGPDSLQR